MKRNRRLFGIAFAVSFFLLTPEMGRSASLPKSSVEMLKKLWADGLSASQIAGRLGEVTRNAVIGKVHRLGLAGRATTRSLP